MIEIKYWQSIFLRNLEKLAENGSFIEIGGQSVIWTNGIESWRILIIKMGFLIICIKMGILK